MAGDMTERIVGAGVTLGIAGAALGMVERAGRAGRSGVGSERAPAQEQTRRTKKRGSSGYPGISRNQFLEIWWKVSPQTYGSFHKRAGGKGSKMIATLNLDAERLTSKAKLQDRILASAYGV